MKKENFCNFLYNSVFIKKEERKGLSRYKTGPDEWAIYKDDDQRILYFVFSGTDDFMEWKSNAKIKLNNGVHSGFWTTACRIWNQINEKIQLSDLNHYEIYSIGYSRGGPLAMLIGCFFGTKTKVVTYGSPRLGNEKGYEFCVEHLIYSNVLHIVQRGDYVTRAPSKRKYVDNFGKKKLQGHRIQWFMPWNVKKNHEIYFKEEK